MSYALFLAFRRVSICKLERFAGNVFSDSMGPHLRVKCTVVDTVNCRGFLREPHMSGLHLQNQISKQSCKLFRLSWLPAVTPHVATSEGPEVV